MSTERTDWWRDRTDLVGECWIWNRYVHKNGYGRGGRRTGKIREDYWAHRLSYEEFVGEIPGGLEIDHLCRVRACVNPDHLEAVDRRTNLLRGEGFTARQARQTHCKHGHSLDGENLYEHRGHRYCKTCRKAAFRAWYARKAS